jgi:hypothetical protein
VTDVVEAVPRILGSIDLMNPDYFGGLFLVPAYLGAFLSFASYLRLEMSQV